MKHTMKITLLLVLIFILAQAMGLVIVKSYVKAIDPDTGVIDYKELPGNIARPQVSPQESLLLIGGTIIVGTIIVLLLIRFRFRRFWKVWFFLSIFACLTFAFGAFMDARLAAALSLILTVFKVLKRNIWIHNITELFIYGGLAAIFVPILNVWYAFLLLVLISAYDAFAVWQSKHMITLANFQTDEKLFAGLTIPYYRKKDKGHENREINKAQLKQVSSKKIKIGAKPAMANLTASPAKDTGQKTAILGGGDIGFPLIFAGTVLQWLVQQNPAAPWQMLLITMLIPLFAALALFILFIKAKEDRFYPAMPFISAGCFFGFGVIILLSYVLP